MKSKDIFTPSLFPDEERPEKENLPRPILPKVSELPPLKKKEPGWINKGSEKREEK